MLSTGTSMLACGALVAAAARAAPPVAVVSPDGHVRAEVSVDLDQRLRYRVLFDGVEAVAPSRVGMAADRVDLSSGVSLGRARHTVVRQTFAVHGAQAVARSHARQISVPIYHQSGETNWLDVRIANDGVAVRFRLSPKPARHFDRDTGSWRLPPGSKMWFQTDLLAYDGLFESALIGATEPGQLLALPITVQLPGSSGFALLTEANLDEYSDAALLSGDDHALNIVLHADPAGWIVNGDIAQPWRVTLLGRDLNTIVTSEFIRSLCPPPEHLFKFATWVKPGRVVSSTWSTGPPEYSEQRRWLNWTHELGFEYYLAGEGWKDWQDGERDAWACLRLVCEYARKDSIGVWIWAHHRDVSDAHTRAAFLEKAKQAGAVGVKIDGVPRASHHWLEWYRETLRDAASRQLMIDLHGSVKPTGLDRTWPNELTRAALRGHEGSSPGSGTNLPQAHDETLPFTRMAVGNGDYVPTMFRREDLRGLTWAHELAQAIVFPSPLLCFADHPRAYLDNPALDVLKAIPPTWDETLVLPPSEIGKIANFARRKGRQWFVGVVNGAEAHKLTVPLDFLGGGKWRMTTLADQPDRDDAWLREEKTATADDELRLTVRPGGGLVVRLTWIDPHPKPERPPKRAK